MTCEIAKKSSKFVYSIFEIALIFMLQAVGMGAAFWGCSDWITARNEHNNQRWDAAAITFFVLGIIRLIAAPIVIKSEAYLPSNCLLKSRGLLEAIKSPFERSNDNRIGKGIGCVFLFILEVLGAAGAIWGSSEVLGLRKKENQQKAWRIIAAVIVTIALGRFILKSQKYYSRKPTILAIFEPWEIKRAEYKMIMIPSLVLGISITFTLEVLGAIGAFWGMMEAFGCRQEGNQEDYDNVAIGIGIWGLIMYIIKFITPQKDTKNAEGTPLLPTTYKEQGQLVINS